MNAGGFFYSKGDQYSFPAPNSKTAFIVKALKVKFFRPIESKIRRTCRINSMQRETSVVLKAPKATNQIQSGPLLCEAQRHDIGLGLLPSRVLVSDCQPLVPIQSIADLLKNARPNVGR